jgi:hypothetical protein
MINDGYDWWYLGETKIKDFEALKKARLKSKKWNIFYTLLQTGAILVNKQGL